LKRFDLVVPFFSRHTASPLEGLPEKHDSIHGAEAAYYAKSRLLSTLS
jgi:hypothetical protein